jgi:copper(I)-binding protein
MKYFHNLLFLTLTLCISFQIKAHEDHKHDDLIDDKQLMIHSPKVSITPPGIQNTAAYFHLMNDSQTDLTLVKVSSRAAKIVEIHEHTMKDGLMKMQKVDSLAIPAKSTINFEPGGYHIMLIDVKERIDEGDKIKLVLEFDNGMKKKIKAVAVKEVSPGKKTKHHHHY